MASSISRPEFIDQIKKFIVGNNIVGYTAGVCVALGTADVIDSAVSNIVVPGVILLLLATDVKFLHNHLPKNVHLNVTDFVKKFFTWLLLIVMTFLFVKLAFEKLLGVKGVAKVTSAGASSAPSINSAAAPAPAPAPAAAAPPMVSYSGPQQQQFNQTLEQQKIFEREQLTAPQGGAKVEPFRAGGAGCGCAL